MSDQNFLILGASSGIGNAIAHSICLEQGKIIAVARNLEKLETLQAQYPDLVTIVQADVTTAKGLEAIQESVEGLWLHGILMNSGGPSAGNFIDSSIEDWDKGYAVVVRWKIELLLQLIPKLVDQDYGRVLFIESVSIKQPIPGLVMSNVYRMAIVGLMKSIVAEIKNKNITLNILAPGYHKTDRLKSLIQKQVTEQQTSSEVENDFASNTSVGRLGLPEELAAYATWLLGSGSGYVTGQTLLVDGGLFKGSL